MNRILLFLTLAIGLQVNGQVININNVSTSGRFNGCNGNNNPAISLTYLSGNGSNFSNGAIVCTDPCGTTTMHVVINNIKWQQNPDAEWLHGIFLPANAGYTVSGINLPPGFITYNAGCQGQCPVGISAGPGFYFDNTAGQDCCGTITAMDGYPCNNYGYGIWNCNNTYSLDFNLTFCNSILTSNTETFTLTGTSDGATGCWSYFNVDTHTINFTINVVPCSPVYTTSFTAGPIVRSCSGGSENFTCELSGGCGNGNTVTWWDAPTGGNLLGTGTPYTYDPSGSTCPAGQTVYASCCSGGSTTCINRQPVTISGSCNSLLLNSITSNSGNCQVQSSISAVSVSNSIGTLTYNLMPGNQSNNTGVFNGLTLGSYTVTVTDASMCSVSSIVTFTPINVPSLSLSATPISCFGGTSSLTCVGGNGQSPFEYSIVQGTYTSNNVFNGLIAGVYTITVKDANNCTNSSTINIAQPTVLSVSGSSTNILCNGGTSTITATGTGGTTAYQFSLNGGAYQSGNTFANNIAGSYTITMKDANNCTATTTLNLTQPTLLSVTASSGIILCNGGTTTITATGTGGTTAYQYKLNAGAYQTGNTFTNIVAGSYTVTIKDANNCTATSAITIAQPTALSVTASSGNILCNGGTSTITATGTGGTTAYQYKLNAGAYQTGNTFTNNVAGSYTVTIKDANNCTATTAITISQPTALSVTASSGNILCNGGTSTITATGSGGTIAYQYKLNAGAYQSGNTFANNMVGNYTITIKDANNCTATTSISIAQPSPLSVSASAPNILCNGGSGTITATGTGGTTAYQYSLNGGVYQIGNTFTNNVAGSYTVTIKDANNCTATTAITISQPTALNVTASSGNILCTGGTSTITATGTGGTTAYQYKLNAGAYQSGNTFTNNIAGSYTVTIKDANNCTATSVITISQPAALTVSASSGNILCNGGTSTITASGAGGTTAYQYKLNAGAYQTGNTFTNNMAGSYTVTIKDANNCTATTAINIVQPTALSVTTSAGNILCNGGTSTITATGTGGTTAYQYSLNGGAYQSGNTFANNIAGSYTVTIKDANNCTATTAITITQPSVLSVSASAPNILCNGGTSTITVTGTGGTTAYQYKLNAGTYQAGNSFANNVTGSYTVTIKDANNCTATTLVTLSQPTAGLSVTASAGNILCNGGTSTITATGTGGTIAYQYSLNGGAYQIGNTFANNAAGSYIVTIKDANNCTATTSINIVQPSALAVTASAGNILCNGGTVAITATGTGGTTAYQYSLNGGIYQTGNTFINNIAGSYTISIKDANNCTATSAITIAQPTALSVTASSSNILCNGGTSTITASGTGGTSAYQYKLNAGIYQAGNSFINNTAGSYTVTIKDANNCTATTVITISQPTILSVSASAPSILCNGGTSTVTATGTGGTTAYQYSLNGGAYQTGNTFANITAGNYTITVKDANNCTATTAITISQPTALNVTASSGNILCNGGTSTITATGSGGTIAYQYKLNAGVYQAGNTFTNNLAGSYTITLKDANNCTATSANTIAQPTALSVTASSSNILCNGGTSTITVTGTGGTTAYQYKLNAGAYQTGNTFTNIVAGSYTVTIKDANNCTATSAITIAQPTALSVTASAGNILCNGGTSTITVTGTGGTTAYQYKLNAGAYQTGNTFTNNVAGSYTITIKDANNCTATTAITISQPTALSVTASSGNILCNGGTSTITATGTGGTSAYQYKLNAGAYQTGNTFTNNVAGSYTVTIKDANNCTATSAITIAQPTALSVTASSGNILCNAGTSTITATGTGGTTAYQYSLNGGTYQTGNTFNNNTAGSFTITIKDANNCTATTAITILQPTILSVTATAPNILCNGGTSTITATGTGGTTAYQFSLNGGAYQSGNTFANNMAGSYTVTIKDANNCTATTTITISQPTALSVTASAGNILCHGGSSTITAAGIGGTTAYQYKLNAGAYQTGNTFTNNVAGSYTITIKDANNCTATTAITISQPTLLSVTTSAGTILCNGGTSTITATGSGGTTAYQYSLNGGAYQTGNTFSNNLAGSYTVTIKDANNCTATSAITISQPSVLSVSASAPNILCNGGASTITAIGTGGTTVYQYKLNTGAYQAGNTFANNLIGIYTITIKDANNCTATTSVSISQPTILSITNISSTVPTCIPGNDASLTVAATGGTTSYQYSINGGLYQSSNVFANLGAATYTIIVKDANNCTVSSIHSISIPGSPVINNTNITPVTCFGLNNGQITVTSSGGSNPINYTLLPGNLSNSNGTFTALNAGSYTVVVSDANSCSVSTLITVSQPNQLTVTANAPNILCNGGATTLTVTGTGGTTAYQYKLNAGAYQSGNTFPNITAGSYTITIKDANNCTATNSISITQPTPLSVTASASTILCNGGSSTIAAIGTGGTISYQYSLNGGAFQTSNSFANNLAGSYTITIKDANNCTASTSITISQPTILSVTTIGTTILCNGGTSTITATGVGGTIAYQYSLNGGPYQTGNTFANNLAGSYTITIKDANNCTATSEITLLQPTVLSVTASSGIILCNGGNSTITAIGTGGTTAYQYKLNTGAYQSGNTFANNVAGSYTITIKDANNCTATSAITITQPTSLSVTATATNILCNGGTSAITATGVGGTSAYQYSLNGGAYQAGNTFSNNAPGSYTITIKDANNCTATSAITITQPPILTLSASATNILCQGGTSTITATGTGGTPAYQYSLNGGAFQTGNTFLNNNAGSYTVTIKDANNCTATYAITITQPTVLTLTASASNILCNGGTSIITATGTGGTPAYQYSLNGGAYQTGNIFANNVAGSYTITVKDANNCTTTTTITIAQPGALSVTASSSNILCFGGTSIITATGTGGTTTYQYSLNGAAYQPGNTFTNNTPGNYTITIKDANNCTATTTVNISQPTQLLLSNVSSTIPTCIPGNDASLTVTATGGTTSYQFSINGGAYQNSNIFTNLGAATYTVIVKDANNCTVSSIHTISIPGSPIVTSANATSVSCNGLSDGGLSVTTSGGTLPIQYTLQPNNLVNNTGQFLNLMAGTYSVIASDANNCSVSTLITIIQPALLTNNLSSTPILCFGDYSTITSTVTGGTLAYQYNINQGLYQPSNIFPGVVAGTYTVGVKDANNCTNSSIITISQPSLLNASASANPILCFGNNTSITVNSSGGTPNYQYSLNGGLFQSSNIFNGIAIGNYSIVVKDANNCTTSTTIQINQPPLLTVTASAGTILCYNGNTSITATGVGGTGTYSYSLNGSTFQSSNIFNNAVANTYTITIKDANNCTATTNVTITQPTQLQVAANSSTILCNGGTSTITVNGSGGTTAYQYKLNAGAYQNGNTFTNITAGNYTVTLKDANNCTATTSLLINQPSPLTVSATASTILCNGGNSIITATAFGGTTPYQFSLNGGAYQNSNSFAGNNPGTYTITIKDGNNCTQSTIIGITQPPLLVIDSIQSTTPTCIPGNDGTLTIYANGGSPNYAYSIGSGSQPTNVFSGLASSAYVITVTDQNGCTATSVSNIIPPNSPTISSVIITDVTCNGLANGEINITAAGGFGMLNYTLQPNNLTNVNGQFTGLVTGSYTIVVSDNNNCTVSTLVNVNQPNLVSVSLSSSTILCYGGNATMTATANGGNSMYQYSLNNGPYQNANMFSGLLAGNYTVTVKDGNNCTGSSVLNITQPTQLLANLTNTSILCYGGLANLTALGNGGTIGYQYSLNGGALQTNNFYQNVPAGNYSVVITDANGCTASSSISVSQPSDLTITNVSTTIPTCIPGNDATITITANGATPNYQYSVNGGGLQTSNVMVGLGIATYTVMVTDANGCTETSSIIITAPNAPVIDSSVTDSVSCNGGNDGELTIYASGGNGILGYELQPIGILNNNGIFAGLSAGNYIAVVTDANNCSVSAIYTINQPSLLQATASSGLILCYAGTTDITASATGGIGNYTYSLNNGPFQVSNVFNAQIAGNYTITVKDANNCTSSTTLNIIQPTALTVSLNAPGILCNSGTTTITAVASGGTTNYQFSLNGGAYQSNNTFAGIAAGNYTIVVKDANDCTVSSVINLIQPNVLTIDSLQQTSPTCIPGNDGSISVFVSGGTPTYQYNAGGANQSSSIITGLGPANYVVTVTDLNGCTATSTMLIVAPNSPLFDSVGLISPSCFGGNNGQLNIYASGGLGTITYLLLPLNVSNTNGSFNNVSAGNYTVVISDANNCTSSTNIVLTEPSLLTLSGNANAILCQGDTTTLTITGLGGTPNYEYNINGGAFQNGNIFSGLLAGNYTIQIKDAMGCTQTDIVNISEPSSLVISLSASYILCNGGVSTLTASVTGGVSGYQYSLNGGVFQTGNSFSNLPVGNYTITAQDANNCTVTSTIQINQPSVLVIDSLQTTTPTCIPGNDGTITVFASGGSPSYNYSVGGPAQTSNVLAGLAAGSYTVIVSDINGCTETSSVVVNSPTSPIWTTLNDTDVNCFGGNDGNITSVATGGLGLLTYNLLPNNITNNTGSFFGLTAGSYTVVVSDINLCTASNIFTISQPAPLQFITASAVSTLCNTSSDGEIHVSATGGNGIITYTLVNPAQSNNTGDFISLLPATYTITATDINNCTISTVLTVSAPPALNIVSLNQQNETCNNTQDGFVNIVANGGSGVISYNLQPNNINNLTGSFLNLSGNTYTVTMTDANNCTLSTVVVIVNPTPVIFASVNQTNVLCAGNSDGTITVVASGGNAGGYTYTLMPGNVNNNTGSFLNLSDNTYTITAKDVKNCSVSVVVTITSPSPILLTIDSTVDATCNNVNNGKVYTSISGGISGFTYTVLPVGLTNNTGDFSNLFAGTYTILVTDANGCSTTAGPFTINQPPPIVFTLISKTDVTCFGGNNGQINIAANGGTGSINLSITPNVGNQNPSGVFNFLTANNYTITATDVNGCTQTTLVSIGQNPALIFDSIVLTRPTCHGDGDGIIDAYASGGVGTLLYQLNNGSSLNPGHFISLIAGNYLITVTDQLGCKKDSLVELTQPDPLAVDYLEIIAAQCEDNRNGKIIVKAKGGNADYTYILRPFIRINKYGSFNDLEAGIYTITIKDIKGCEIDTIVTVEPPSVNMSLEIEKNDLGCFGYGTEGWAKVNVYDGTPPFTYTWSSVPVQHTETATGLIYGWYFVDVVDGNGCKKTDTVYINPGECCEEVFIPNAFTPNNDGQNDVFRVITSTGIELIQFSVYDRWGKRVWTTPDFRRAWDGKVDGRLTDANTFYYIFHYKCLTDGKTYMKKGDVIVVH